MAVQTPNIIPNAHNSAKRVPKSAVFTLDMEVAGSKLLEEETHRVGFIEPNIAITRVMCIVEKAFNGTTPDVNFTGGSENYFTGIDLTVEAVYSSPIADGTMLPFYKDLKTQFDAFILIFGSTEGRVKFVVEYVQLDTEPGLHTGETVVGA